MDVSMFEMEGSVQGKFELTGAIKKINTNTTEHIRNL